MRTQTYAIETEGCDPYSVPRSLRPSATDTHIIARTARSLACWDAARGFTRDRDAFVATMLELLK